MPNKAIKGRVIQAREQNKRYYNEKNKQLVRYQQSPEYVRHEKQDVYRGGHHKQQTTKNPFEHLGYMGDKIGLIHIKRLSPWLKN